MILSYNISPNANVLDSFPKGIYSPVVSVRELIRTWLITYCAAEKPAANIPALSPLRAEVWSELSLQQRLLVNLVIPTQ